VIVHELWHHSVRMNNGCHHSAVNAGLSVPLLQYYCTIHGRMWSAEKGGPQTVPEDRTLVKFPCVRLTLEDRSPRATYIHYYVGRGATDMARI
jgi:hypothetical protein